MGLLSAVGLARNWGCVIGSTGTGSLRLEPDNVESGRPRGGHR